MIHENDNGEKLYKSVEKEDGSYDNIDFTKEERYKFYTQEKEQSKIQYIQDRKIAYDKLNQFELQFNDMQDGTNTWQEAIQAIKDKYPKPIS
jgi:FtsZ-binding cell division protein ZapB